MHFEGRGEKKKLKRGEGGGREVGGPVFILALILIQLPINFQNSVHVCGMEKRGWTDYLEAIITNKQTNRKGEKCMRI